MCHPYETLTITKHPMLGSTAQMRLWSTSTGTPWSPKNTTTVPRPCLGSISRNPFLPVHLTPARSPSLQCRDRQLACLTRGKLEHTHSTIPQSSSMCGSHGQPCADAMHWVISSPVCLSAVCHISLCVLPLLAGGGHGRKPVLGLFVQFERSTVCFRLGGCEIGSCVVVLVV